MTRKHKFAPILFIGSFIACIILIAGYVLPAALISEGLESYTGQDQKRAESALTHVESFLSSPSIYRIYITKFKVISIKPAEPSECGDYEAVIYGYTYFGFHTQTWRVGPRGCPELLG